MKRLVTKLLLLLLIGLLCAAAGSASAAGGSCRNLSSSTARPHSVTITEFGAVGDGVTLNTVPFQNAVFYLRSFADKGGAQLYVPKGRWLTGSFNLTSHLTLFLEQDAVIIGTQDAKQWRRSLINGNNVSDVVITGSSGVIDGQGNGTLNSGRAHLVEFTSGGGIVITNLTFLNPPACGIHTVSCSGVKVKDVVIRSPADAPLTDGIVPDSCTDVCIEDSTVEVSHDAIALKSAAAASPTADVHIARVDLRAASGAALAVGSSLSGGISDIHAEHLHITNSAYGMLLETSPGSGGGYIRDVVVSGAVIQDTAVAVQLTGNSTFNSGIPRISRITLKDMVGANIAVAGILSDIADICLSNLNFSWASSPWSCSGVSGYSELVIPEPCPDLVTPPSSSANCFSLLSYTALSSA